MGMREYDKAWRKANPERIKAHRRKTYLKHRERILAEARARYAAFGKEDRRKYYGKKSAKAQKRWAERYPERRLSSQRAWYDRNLPKVLWKAAKYRAAKSGLPFDIEPSDVVIPKRCPVFGVELTRVRGKGPQPTSPTIDRIHPEMGYVRGNIAVISKWANDIKSYGTAAEHRQVAAWLDEQQCVHQIPGKPKGGK